MTRFDFPTITPDIARRYITTARLSPNAVALRIRQMLAKPVMKCVCAWCGQSLADVPCIPSQAGKTSHGLCDACAEKHFSPLQRDTPMCERPEQNTTSWVEELESGARRHAATFSRLGTGRACVPLELARTIEPDAVAQACSKSGSMSPDGNLPSEGAETGRKTACTEAELRAEDILGGDANTVRKATERSLTACESEQANFPAGYHINLPARR